MTEKADSEGGKNCEAFDAEAWVTDFEEAGGRCYIDQKSDHVITMIQVMGYSEGDNLRAKALHDKLLNGDEMEDRLAAVDAVVKARAAYRYDKKWPDQPDLSMMAAALFQRLGGSFSISSEGKRYMCQPLPGMYDRLSQVPQLPSAVHRHRFESEAEWLGAMKLLSYCIEHASDTDRDLMFDVLAPIALDPRKSFDFREHLQ